ncbi:hypothetical protein H0H92_004406 [Tricholoma furcatifolium]|nr:hypothetical protein H0H92_004406 [Tricholoma furcatifolium]
MRNKKSKRIRLAQPPLENVGIFKNGYKETPENSVFLKYVAPLYRRAHSEGRAELFWELLFPVWFDRFPVILLDGVDDDEGGVNPDRVDFYKERQKKYLRTKMYWKGLFHGANFREPEYANWDGLLTLQADRIRRHQVYLENAARGVYLYGYEYHEGVVSQAEREAELKGEALFQLQLDVIQQRIPPAPRPRRLRFVINKETNTVGCEYEDEVS